mmetsp:Transcript_6317/g.11252  ORF Transcript_6317/g.11252 Transcript_6317/m.11252 type:complete len:198 (-) Transcript_6317:300-893(-)|eukprot:CAMPEP_0183726752 /NCGR_PEP_ID=MMETSP0737-20130205/24088_1 /TAXON_ID=385413 /ORGANISM="Thalassiosira miniscula, Strain CCMP1093" /LENGTH=197 /DNA_ID=CAMNT_0025958185 /DNA_START=113 /DNA_END=706 /DNA_ORIENTATION=-
MILKSAAPFAFAILIHVGQAFRTGFNPIQSAVVDRTSTTPPILSPSASAFGYKKSIYRTALAAGENNEATTTASSPTAESILDEFHQFNLPFRIVVIGNGAILETTSKLGPTSKSSISPKSGERLLTFASEDQSFEFHVKVDQVCKIVFVATEERRVARFLSENGTPISSLILADKSEEAGKWFDGLVQEHGNEVIM